MNDILKMFLASNAVVTGLIGGLAYSITENLENLIMISAAWNGLFFSVLAVSIVLSPFVYIYNEYFTKKRN